MKPTLAPGVSRTKTLVVDEPRTIAFMGEEGRVYSTPNMVSDMEYACRELIMEHAEADEDSVGIAVSMQHLAPTLLGMRVEVTVTVTAVEGRKISFEGVVRDEVEAVGRGEHTRFVVQTEKRRASLRAKAARWRALGGG